MQIDLDIIEVLVLSIFVLYVGFRITSAVGFLAKNNIPPAVTGGLLFSLLLALANEFFGLKVTFDLNLRDELLLVFFSTVGLSSKVRTLIAGGKALVILIVVTAVFLVLQSGTGVLIAVADGLDPRLGLMGGSLAFAGGHGTVIAWSGSEAFSGAGLEGAGSLGIVFATAGLVAGGLVGGPVARWLIGRHKLQSGPSVEQLNALGYDVDTQGAGHLNTILTIIFVIGICILLGHILNDLLSALGATLPSFLTAMVFAIIIANLVELPGIKVTLNPVTIERIGEVSLNVFLSMSLMSLDLLVLAKAAGFVLLVLAVQIVLMIIVAIFVIFRAMGRDFDAAVITAGFCGLGLGATPVAMANMDSVTRSFGPSPKAFLVVPLVGAFFLDILNNFGISLVLWMI